MQGIWPLFTCSDPNLDGAVRPQPLGIAALSG